MNRWTGKIAVVTGASSGIGLATAKLLANNGLIVIGLARRENQMNQLKDELKSAKGRFHSYKCDVTDLDSVRNVFSQIQQKFGRVNVLVNNAGIFRNTFLLESENVDDLEAILKTNFMGSIYCIKEMYAIMKDVEEDCHIINISSVLGNFVHPEYANMANMYPSSKHALRASADVLRAELAVAGKKNFRVTTISPGVVETEMTTKSGLFTADFRPDCLQSEDIANSVKFVLEMPRHVQVSEMTVMPV